MRYLDIAGLSPSHPTEAYAHAVGAEYDKVSIDVHALAYGDVVVTGPWSDWSWLPSYIEVEVVPDGTEVKRREPLRAALDARSLPSSYYSSPPKTARAAGYAGYQEALQWAEEMTQLFARAPRIEVKSQAPFEVVRNADRAREVLRHLALQPAASYDYETNSLNPYLITKRALAFADARDSWYLIPPVLEEVRDEVRELLCDARVEWRASNIKYDLQVSSVWHDMPAMEYAPVRDSQPQHWLLFPDDFQHGLKYITKKDLKREVLALDDLGGPEKFWELPYETQALYAAAGDTRNSYDLVEKYNVQLAERGLLDLYLRVEQPVQAVLAEMEMEGLPLGRARLIELAYTYQQKAERIVADLRAIGFVDNPNADEAIARFLFTTLGLPVLVKTAKTKRGSVALDVLRMLRLRLEGVPGAERGLRAVQLFIEWSEVDKARNTFLNPPLEAGLTRFMFALQQTSVKTGRLSTKPQAQNWPEKIQDICEAEEQDELTDADLGQIEPRIGAHLSQDPRMLAVFRGEAGELDAYQALGVDMGFSIDRLGKHSALRKNIKTVYLAEQYGGGAGKIQLIALRQGEFIPLAQCRELMEGIHRARPVYYGWREQYVKECRRDGTARDPLFGRLIDKRRGLFAIDPGARDAAERECMNWPMQAGAGSTIKLSMPSAQKLFREAGGSLLNQIHDELLGRTLRLTSTQRVDFDAELAKLMTSQIDLSVPLVAEVGSGRTWREAKHG